MNFSGLGDRLRLFFFVVIDIGVEAIFGGIESLEFKWVLV